MKRKLLTFGNRKLSNKQAIWTLPAGKTCIGAGECAKWCYSKKAEKCYPQVRASREWKLEQAKRKDFVQLMVQAIKESKRKIVRCHQDGDFFSQAYLNKWKEIARQLPDVTIYAFTKSFAQLDFWTNLPDNFVVIQSYGSKYDNKIDYSKNTARVIDSLTELRKTEHLCPYHDKEHFKKCGETCSYCFSKFPKVKHIAFLKH